MLAITTQPTASYGFTIASSLCTSHLLPEASTWINPSPHHSGLQHGRESEQTESAKVEGSSSIGNTRWSNKPQADPWTLRAAWRKRWRFQSIGYSCTGTP